LVAASAEQLLGGPVLSTSFLAELVEVCDSQATIASTVELAGRP
jgi:hypothetical protein